MNSIVSYPNRGPWGSSSWRGNTTGHMLVDLFKQMRPASVIDPARGSDTTGDVCREMGIKYVGLDLHMGFNLLRHSVRLEAGKQGLPMADMLFFHPPYGDIIVYSGVMYPGAHKDDLSRCASHDDFMAKLELSLINCYDAVNRGGHLAVLIGDMRKKGEYFSPQARIAEMGLGKLAGIIIKQQHNCHSDSRRYSGNFIPIVHEYLLLLRKEQPQTIVDFLTSRTLKVYRSVLGTWKNVVHYALMRLGGQAKLGDIYGFVGTHVDAGENQNVQAKIRQILQRHFARVEEGVWALPA
jgi:hypothetical protein